MPIFKKSKIDVINITCFQLAQFLRKVQYKDKIDFQVLNRRINFIN